MDIIAPMLGTLGPNAGYKRHNARGIALARPWARAERRAVKLGERIAVRAHIADELELLGLAVEGPAITFEAAGPETYADFVMDQAITYLESVRETEAQDRADSLATEAIYGDTLAASEVASWGFHVIDEAA